MGLFKQYGNHVVGSFIGGSFLGVILWQLPGTIIGGILGLIYAISTLPRAETYESKPKEDQ